MKLLAAFAFALMASAAQAEDLKVFAAASMKEAIDEIGASYKAKTGSGIIASYGSSGTLAKQIEAAAPADVFISADEEWMDKLAGEKLIKPETRHDIAGNALVLIAAKDASPVKIAGLAANLQDKKLALAEVTSVPAGKYAKTSFEKLGLWSIVEKSVVMQDNVRSTMTLVTRGEAAYGVVYNTDALVEPKVKVVDTFAEDTHKPIRYPAAVVAASQNPEAAKFAAFLTGDEAQAILKKDGFTTAK